MTSLNRLEIRADDDEVDVLDLLHSLELDDDLARDEKVETMNTDSLPAIRDRHLHLRFEHDGTVR